MVHRLRTLLLLVVFATSVALETSDEIADKQDQQQQQQQQQRPPQEQQHAVVDFSKTATRHTIGAAVKPQSCVRDHQQLHARTSNTNAVARSASVSEKYRLGVDTNATLPGQQLISSGQSHTQQRASAQHTQ